MVDDLLYTLVKKLTKEIEDLKEEIQFLNFRLSQSEVQRFYGEQHQLITDKEKKYIDNDVLIVKETLEQLKDNK